MSNKHRLRQTGLIYPRERWLESTQATAIKEDESKKLNGCSLTRCFNVISFRESLKSVLIKNKLKCTGFDVTHFL